MGKASKARQRAERAAPTHALSVDVPRRTGWTHRDDLFGFLHSPIQQNMDMQEEVCIADGPIPPKPDSIIAAENDRRIMLEMERKQRLYDDEATRRRRALDRLRSMSPVAYDVWVLLCVEGRSHAELAEHFLCTPADIPQKWIKHLVLVLRMHYKIVNGVEAPPGFPDIPSPT